MVHLILTGATGLVGSGVLHHILSLSPSAAAAQGITRLSILSRRTKIPLLDHPKCPKDNTYTKIEVISHTDFGVYDEQVLVKLRLKPGDEEGEGEVDNKVGVIWALGISQGQVKTEAEYVTITKAYALEAAKAFSTAMLGGPSLASSSSLLSSSSQPQQQQQQQATKTSVKNNQKPQQLNFIYVSGEGASHTPSQYLTPLFGRVKGETEIGLLKLTSTFPLLLRPYNVRPAAVDSHNQPAVWDVAFSKSIGDSLAKRILSGIMLPLMRAGVWSNGHSPTEELGRVFVDLACGDGAGLTGPGIEGDAGRVVRNSGLRRLFRKVSPQTPLDQRQRNRAVLLYGFVPVLITVLLATYKTKT